MENVIEKAWPALMIGGQYKSPEKKKIIITGGERLWAWKDW